MPNLAVLPICQKVKFWGDILGQEIPNHHDPYIQYKRVLYNYIHEGTIAVAVV